MHGLVGEIRSFLSKQVLFLAITGTASPLTRDKIIKSLSLKKCLEISVSPNRENIKLGPLVQRPVSANPGLNFNPGLFFFSSKAFSLTIFSILFRVANHQIVDKRN